MARPQNQSESKMKSDSSKAWRHQGEVSAFDDGAFEFQSRNFFFSAARLLIVLDEGLTKIPPDYDVVAVVQPAQFLASLALELIAKAYYLRSKLGSKEDIYVHNVIELCGTGFFTPEQEKLMRYAAQYVIWAGRYPTPVWKTEKQKQAYDVPSTFIDGVEQVNSKDIPNSASTGKIDELLKLYGYIHEKWKSLP